MKRRFCFIYAFYIACISLFIFFGWRTNGAENNSAEVYFVDTDMLRLVSANVDLTKNTAGGKACEMIDIIIEGRDYNGKIRRVVPNICNCLSVKVNGNTAYVDILEDSIPLFPDGRVSEELIIYQIVNSLTSIEGIDKVKFTVGGKENRKFKGFIDMRETFIPDYYV